MSAHEPLTSNRLVSLDVFRGITILGMILVNNPGTWSAMYPPLRHADWHGWTPTDLIFPFFLFIVGVAIVYAYSGKLAKGIDKKSLVLTALKRSGVLFLLGLIMAAYPVFTFDPEFGFRDGLDKLRIMGVLQRIALCYFAASVIFLYAKPKIQMYWMVGLVVLYWLAMMLIPVPGHGAGLIDDKINNLAAFIDRAILGEHLWVGTGRQWDPEGLLSTIPAISTTLIGVWAGNILKSKTDESTSKTAQLMIFGTILIIVGYVWDWFFPINKPIWTSSYAIFTGGQAMCGLALCYWFIDVKGYKKWTEPFVAYGVNAITVFFMSGIIARTLNIFQVTLESGASVSVQRWIFLTFFDSWLETIHASFAYSVVWVFIWYLILLVMFRKNIIIKV
jgi:predicted acyltransferase